LGRKAEELKQLIGIDIAMPLKKFTIVVSLVEGIAIVVLSNDSHNTPFVIVELVL